MADNPDLEELRTEFLERTSAAVQGALGYEAGLDQLSYLWIENREEALKKFLSQETPEGDFQQPPLERFKEQIDKYEAVCTEVSWCDIVGLNYP